jgi:hypothetical protein
MNLFFKKKEFPDLLSTSVFTTVYVVESKSVITLVAHELDGAWQFMGDDPIGEDLSIAKVIPLEEMIRIDQSILQVADLPLGYQATRMHKKDKWEISKINYTDDEIAEMGFYCEVCGKFHQTVPMAYGADAPTIYFQMLEEEARKRCRLTPDTCIVDEDRFFVRGKILIAVDGKEVFCWMAWVEVSQADFYKIQKLDDVENRYLVPPYHGNLATQLPCYPDTLNLPVQLRLQELGESPLIQVTESAHPLSLEQMHGIDMGRVTNFAKRIIYAHD